MTEVSFEGQLYAWGDRPDSWVFVNLPPALSDAIDEALVSPPRAFGSVRVEARLGAVTWRTSLFPSKQEGTYVLPVKKLVRRRAGDVGPGDTVVVSLTVLDQ